MLRCCEYVLFVCCVLDGAERCATQPHQSQLLRIVCKSVQLPAVANWLWPTIICYFSVYTSEAKSSCIGSSRNIIRLRMEETH